MNSYQPSPPLTRLAAIVLALLAMATFATFNPYLVIAFALAQAIVPWLAFSYMTRLIRALCGAKPGFRSAISRKCLRAKPL